MSSLIDWSVAEQTARALSPTPPSASPADAAAVVAELHRATERAAALVADLTRLNEPAVSATTVVVDRPGWVSANVASMRVVMEPVVDRLTEKKPPGRIASAIGGRTTGAQAGAILAFLSGKVLGQFEFFSTETGQLLLVAPNIVSVEQSLKVDPTDFRLWVCLHEVTHRVQFTAVPWMRQHMLDEIAQLTDALDVDPDAILERLRHALGELARTAQGKRDTAGIMAALASPQAREIMDRLTGFMSLVEGHAEYVMNAVDRSVIPSQPQIERKFADRRRKGGNPFDRLVRSLLGMDAKTRQYTQGSNFVRTVVDEAGLDAFNAVWSSPSTLPTKAEITDPKAWITRVHG
ncbi:zinc-dependent metalloprotease [Jatrophihabitans telluris]|uniref:Zinc-dependent metalloprotease n=1 Tax=Jatrophihabitans telluris TaxID=2038343 RepID=A0ABY4QZB8_9ACTN|nr:zinc-dependent metalloprotease [Jatrophihabitans telluris]UQX88910.1 zinc-dependent metalloprotease [Jatrophihabitans telluris]